MTVPVTLGCSDASAQPAFAALLLFLFSLSDLVPSSWMMHAFCFFFQVSYIFALSVFEDHLYATHSDPSAGSSSVELIRIHRFNITAESQTLATLGNSKQLRVYHKLTQPKGNAAICTYE